MGLRKRKPASRLRRWTKRVFVTLLTLTLLVGLAAFGVLENLDKPAVKTRLQALLHDKAGLDVDYRTASLELRHGLHLRDVVVRQPEAMRGIASDLVNAKDVSVTWSGVANIAHPERLVVSDAMLVIAVDEEGKTSFDAIRPPDPNEPSTPLSQRGKDIASVTSKLPLTDLDRTRVEVVRKVDGKLDRVAVSGLSVHAAPEKTAHLHASLGQASAPIEVTVVRTVNDAPAGDAHAKVWLDADASSTAVTLTLDLRAAKQSFASEIAAGTDALHAEATAHFDPDGHTTEIRAERIALGDGIADVSGDLDVRDDGAPRIHHAKGVIDFVRALALVPPGLLPVEAKVDKGTANFDVSDIALDKLPALDETAKLSVDANFEELDIAGIHAKSAKVAAHGTGAGETVVDLDVDKSHLHVDATRKGKAIEYSLAGDLPALGPLRRYVPPALVVRTAKVTSKGRVDDVDSDSPSLEQHTEAKFEAPSLQPYGDANELDLVFDAHGTTKKHDAKGTLTVRHLHVAGTDPGDDAVKFALDVDKDAKKLDVNLDASGQASAKVLARLSVDRANAIHYDVDAEISKLKPLAQYLVPGLDLAKLELGIKGKGVVRGPVEAGNVDGNLDIRAQNVDFNSGTLAFAIPEATIDSVIAPDGEKRRITTKLHVAQGKVANATNAFEVKELEDAIIAGVSGPLDEPELSSAHTMTIGDVKQTLLPGYVIGDAKLDLVARRSKDGVIHIADLQFTNGKGGTSLALKGAIDPNEPQRLSLQGDVKQDLAKLSNAPDVFNARGKASVALGIESPDLQVFRTNADLKFENTDVHVPHQNIHIEGANGQVPIVASFRAMADGPKLIRESDNPYAALRFADQHPLLNRSSFLSVKKASLPHDVVIANLVGNFQVVHNIFTLRQFEMGFRGGKVTGQAALDWNDDKSVVDLRVRADHVQSSRGEPFTGSASVIVSAADHDIEGRADVLQIGERHLLDVLELEDPFHTDPQINSVRRALKFGYPDKIRIGFKRGFASAHIELGGLARFFSVDDLKGLPIGPVIDRYLGPLFPVKVETKVGQK